MTKLERILLAIFLILAGLAGFGLPVGLLVALAALVAGIVILLPAVHQPRP